MLPPELIAKLNECSRVDFVALRDNAFFWQVAYSRMVISGLLLEGPELIHEIALIIGKWFTGVVKKFARFRWVVSSERFIECAKIAAFVGWIFIIWGLVGELRVSSRIVDLSASIQECSDAKVREATIDAGDAANSAKIADDHAKSAVEKSDKANTVAGNALAISKAATDAAEKAQEKVGAVAVQADDLDRAIWQTQFLVSARSLRNRELLISTLRKFNKKKIVLTSFIGDAEGWDLCNSLVNVAYNAEMDPVSNCGKEYFSPPLLTGILVFGPTKQEIEEFVNIMADAVDPGGAAGMHPEPGSALTIRVGIKVPYYMEKSRFSIRRRRDKPLNQIPSHSACERETAPLPKVRYTRSALL